VINNNFWINYHLAKGKNSKLRRVYPTYQQASLHTGRRMKWHTRFVLPQLSGTKLQTLLDAQSHTVLQTRLRTIFLTSPRTSPLTSPRNSRFLPKKRKKAQHNKCILRAEDQGYNCVWLPSVLKPLKLKWIRNDLSFTDYRKADL